MTRISGHLPPSPPNNLKTEGVPLGKQVGKGGIPVRQNSGAQGEKKIDPEVLQAAQGMEAMFLDTMFQVMRQTVQDNDMNLENTATKLERSMMDSELAQNAAKTSGVGLAEQIVAYLEAQGYNNKAGSSNEGTPRSYAGRTGGTK